MSFDTGLRLRSALTQEERTVNFPSHNAFCEQARKKSIEHMLHAGRFPEWLRGSIARPIVLSAVSLSHSIHTIFGTHSTKFCRSTAAKWTLSPRAKTLSHFGTEATFFIGIEHLRHSTPPANRS
jgi:hypothetical protein